MISMIGFISNSSYISAFRTLSLLAGYSLQVTSLLPLFYVLLQTLTRRTFSGEKGTQCWIAENSMGECLNLTRVPKHSECHVAEQ